MGRDIPAAFAGLASRGLIEILTSTATHAYLPMLYEDSSIAAQLRAGIAASKRILGFRPSGVWLPECAYRPPGRWKAPISWGEPRNRQGVEHYLEAESVTHFFVENWLLEQSRSEWVRNGKWQKVGWDEAAKYPNRGWQCVQEPVRVASDGLRSGSTAALARDPRICEQVWSGDIGYPADGVYLEFHKKHGERRGLRYWKITRRRSGLGDKDIYYPQDIQGKIHEHASHFCDQVRQRLWAYNNRTGRHGVVVACFDAELFGHWWFEGPQFLKDVMLTLNANPDVNVETSLSFLKAHPCDKAAALPEGSWGDGGDHRVWTNDKVNWMWEVEYRCEALFGKLTFNLPWESRKDVENLLKKAGRELLLLQASDWPFVIARGQAVDYGIKRFTQHVSRFECLVDIAERVAEDSRYMDGLSNVQKHEIKDADIHDIVFPEIDLKWWKI
jgi:1,4-alpha-glucan branching enzyme